MVAAIDSWEFVLEINERNVLLTIDLLLCELVAIELFGRFGASAGPCKTWLEMFSLIISTSDNKFNMAKLMATEWKKIPVSLAELCLDTTLRCGQSFRWKKLREDEW